MPGPWKEIRRTGTLGAPAVELIYEAVDAVRRFGSYPPPPGFSRWDESAVHDAAHDFIVDGESPSGDGTGRLARLVASATSEESFERLLHTAVKNHFRAAARRTNKGAVHRALTHAVGADDAIVVAGADLKVRTWSLSEHVGNDPYSGDWGPLISAAYAAPGVRLARWKSTTRRQPIAESASLRRVIHAVLEAAAAPVTPALMVEVIVARFPLALGERIVALNDQGDEIADPSGSITLAVPAEADEVWDQLNDNERLVLAVLDQSARKASEQTGLHRNTANRAMRSAALVLRECLRGMDQQESIMQDLRERSRNLQVDGTNRVLSSSEAHKET